MSFLPSFKVAVSNDADIDIVQQAIDTAVKKLSPVFSAAKIAKDQILVSYLSSNKAKGIESIVLAVDGVEGKVAALVPK